MEGVGGLVLVMGHRVMSRSGKGGIQGEISLHKGVGGWDHQLNRVVRGKFHLGCLHSGGICGGP